MFLCKRCLGKYYLGLVTSNGTCECCGEGALCDDHPSKYLPKDWHNPDGCKKRRKRIITKEKKNGIR